ncbi:YjiH family protein [Priestia megaterium]|nr:YjiH family protein [Priestia megaterium]
MILFMIPVPFEDGMTVPVAFLANILGGWLENYIAAIATILMGITFVGSCLAKWVQPSWMIKSPFWSNLFQVTPPFFIARALGFLFAAMVLFEVGPSFIWSENTGGFLLTGLVPVLLTTFLLAGLFLPLLLDFGLLDLCGVLFAKMMRPVFKLPGRSSMDCLASWLGDGTIGVFLTSKQYEDGYYTEREAAVISTTFSVVSITFSIVVITEIGLAHMFVPYYLTIVGVGLVLAVVMPRIPPLSKKKDTYFKEIEHEDEKFVPAGHTPLQWGAVKAIEQARKNRSFSAFMQNGVKNVLDMWLAVIPVVMAIGTISLIIAEYTPFFEWIGAPFVPLLSLMQIPEATEASVSILVGFADMFLPAILSGGIESEMTRFIIACLSVTQLVYMSEVGGLILGSKLPINVKDLVLIFLLRTAIALPLIVLVAHLLF